MTQIIASQKTEFAIDPVILNLLPEQGSIELQHDAAGKVHRFHTHPVDEILVIISGRLNFMWDGGERIVHFVLLMQEAYRRDTAVPAQIPRGLPAPARE